MKYRELGNTGKKVSEIGFGLEHLDRKPYAQVEETLNEALRHGVNLLDIFMPGTEVREHIKKALGNRRKDVYIQGHIGSTDVGKQYDISRDMPTVKKYFEEMLRLYGYIDFGMLFFIDSEEDYKNVFETEFITYAERLKKNGDIHHIGFSSHNPITAAKVIETGMVEMMMFSINPAFDMMPGDLYALDQLDKNFSDVLFKDPNRARGFSEVIREESRNAFRGIRPERVELYTLCAKKQVGITVMKALGSGKLLSPEHTPYKKPLTTYQCVHYALSRPAVASVLPGCQTIEEMKQMMGYFSATDEEKDYAKAISTVRNDFAGNCVYCSHCQPCPVGIDIATVCKYLDIAKLDEKNIPPSIRQHYTAMNVAECIECGHCEKRCPFGVPIIQNMKDAARLCG